MLTVQSRSPRWVVPVRAMKGNIRLFCVPYAGGGPSVFRTWPDEISSDVEIWSVHLPGREARVNEPAIADLRPLIGALSGAIEPYLDRRYALFGHSIGALIAFELAREICRRGRLMPDHLFVSACPAPQLADTDRISDLPEHDFINRLQQFNGTPPEVMTHPELMALMVPTLRADFALRDTYRHVTAPPLKCSISAFAGRDDTTVKLEAIEAWREQTGRRFRLWVLPGDHFFLRDARNPLVSIVSRVLLQEGCETQIPHK
ncbi:thioesterase II family protein [Nitrospira sp. Nam80]